MNTQLNTLNGVHFKNGETVEATDEAKYLGCLLNDNVEAKKELSRRIADSMTTWKNSKNSGKREQRTERKSHRL